MLLRSRRAAGALLLIAVALAGCETARFAAPTLEPASTEIAERAELAGEYVLAAREYERLAETARAPQKQGLLLRAADNLLKGGQLHKAREVIATIVTAGLDPAVNARKRILEARLAALEGEPEKAIRQLDGVQRMRRLDPSLLAEIHQARAQAELALDNPAGALRNLITREQYIVGKEAVAANRAQVWNILDSLSRTRLKTELNATRDPALSGWLELALVAVENAGKPDALEDALARWRKAYPNHPAGESRPTAFAGRAPRLIGRIQRIALLLPLTSGYKHAAAAVRDGFLAMDAANPDPDKPKAQVYDIGADPAQAPAFYAQAVNDGAQVIVGPLGREATDSVVRKADLGVPTLLLSHAEEGDATGYLIQFGLPPEQEARQAAERAYLDGHRRAAVLYPLTSWGERMMLAFTGHWQRLGGVVLASQSYLEEQNDFSEPIRLLLNIVQSEERKALLEAQLRQRLQFEPRPRQDIDFIFLAADARRGRLIKPQINYNRAARVPVYATSHIYAGKSDPAHDADLDGVLFGDMPWMLVGEGKIAELRRSLQRDWPHAYTDLDRLFALGMDSYAILPHLNRIRQESAARFSGVTSGLRLDRDGRLQRQLLWARFRRGVPRLLDGILKPGGRLEVELGPEG